MSKRENIGRICSFCYGSGMLKNDFEDNNEWSICNMCQGDGKMKPHNFCELCNGNGFIIKHCDDCEEIDENCLNPECEEFPCPDCSKQNQEEIPDWGWND